MELITAFDFPFSAIGAVHVENVITRYRPIAVTDTVRATVRAENLREHRKGLLVDVSTELAVGNETAWQQVTTFLHQQRTSLSDEPKPEPPKQPKLPPPNTILRISPDGSASTPPSGRPQSHPHQQARGETVRLPTVIAHGMFSAAAVLANIEGSCPTGFATRSSSASLSSRRPPRACGSTAPATAGISRCAMSARDIPIDGHGPAAAITPSLRPDRTPAGIRDLRAESLEVRRCRSPSARARTG